MHAAPNGPRISRLAADSVTRLGLKRYKSENTLTKILDSKVGCMRLLDGSLLTLFFAADIQQVVRDVARHD